MLEIYLKSIIIYIIIIYCASLICKERIKDRFDKLKNNSKEKKKKSFMSKISNLFILSAIPVLRFIIVLVVFYISLCSEEDFEAMIEKGKE